MPAEDPAAGLGGDVPGWAVRMVRDIAETRGVVNAVKEDVGEIRIKVDHFITRDEYAPAHRELSEKVDKLWDRANTHDGALDQQRRNAFIFRWVFGAAVGLLGVWVALHTGGVSIHFG